MLDKMIIRKLTREDCHGYIEDIERELILTAKRLERLRNTQAKNPGWAAYDKYADDIVGIDIRIEEQHAVSEMLVEELNLLSDREQIIAQAAAYTGITPRLEEPVYQLGFFDSDKKRERMGVLC